METIKRYSIKMGDLSKDGALKGGVSAVRGVPKRFLETPGRMWLKRMIRVMGLFSFVVTVGTIAVFFLGYLLLSMRNEELEGILTAMTVGLFFVNHLGLFIEMGADTTGRNWFAKAAGLLWLSFLGTFVVALLVEIVKAMF